MLKWFSKKDISLFNELYKQQCQSKRPVYEVLGALRKEESIKQFEFVERMPLAVAHLYCKNNFKHYLHDVYVEDATDEWYHVGDESYAAILLFLYKEPINNSLGSLSSKEETIKETTEVSLIKENKIMASNVGETFGTLISMKMLKSVMKDDTDQDLGKLVLMQQMMNGESLRVTDVVKSKIISQFDLTSDEELPLKKVMLLQMLDGGEIDMSQLIMLKMMESMFDDDDDKKENKDKK